MPFQVKNSLPPRYILIYAIKLYTMSLTNDDHPKHTGGLSKATCAIHFMYSPLYQGGLLKYCEVSLLVEVTLFSPTPTSCSWHRSLICESLEITIELQALAVALAVEHLSMHCLSEEDSVWLKASLLFTVLPRLVIHGNHIPIYNKERKWVEKPGDGGVEVKYLTTGLENVLRIWTKRAKITAKE